MKSLPVDVATCHAMIVGLLETVSDAERRYQQLEHRLQILLRQRFGPSAERIDPAQLKLYAEEILGATGGVEAQSPAITVAEHNRSTGRRKLPADLPRIRVEHELSAPERACPCCGELRTKMGEQGSEELEYEPAKLHVIEHVQMTYRCRKCEGELVTAPKAARAIEKCLAGPGLLAQVAVSKYADHLPLHRLERIFKRHGVELSRSTMSDWMRQCAEALEPLVKLMRREVLASAVIHTDDTPVPVQIKGERKPGKTKQGRFWVYVGDQSHRYALFDYTPDRTRDGPVRWLSGFEGYLQADAYAGYEAIYATGKVAEVACWAHARRKFYDARLTDPARCIQAIAWIKRLYEVEGRAKALDDEQRRALRQAEAVPLLGQIKAWLDEQARDVLPKSPTAEAIAYVRSRWKSFTRYTTRGFLAIDNNASENAIRAVALGRKNWLFAGSDRGGCTAAVLFSLIASCKLHDVEPWSWLRHVLRRIPQITASHLPELLPDRCQPDQAATAPAAPPLASAQG